MKIMICTHLDIGALPSIDLPAESVNKWQQDKIDALAAALDAAVEKGARACVFAGGLYARGFVSQSLLVDAIDEAGAHNIPVYYAPLEGESDDLTDRVAVPEALHIIRADNLGAEPSASFVEETQCPVPIYNASALGTMEEAARSIDAPAVVRNGNDIAFCAGGDIIAHIGALEPSSFGEPLSNGYLLAEVDGGQVVRHEWVETARHPFIVRTVRVSEPENAREVTVAVGNAVKDVNRSACLRIQLRGCIPLDVYINTDNLASQLERYFFYVEVADECELDIDVASLDADVSLLGEFVRQVSEDDSLSTTEKTRVLRCGWNALNGKELVE